MPEAYLRAQPLVPGVGDVTSCSTATGSVYPGFDKWNKSAGAGEHRDDIATISIATSREQDYTLPTTML